MNFENEVDYRLAKVLLSNIYHEGILTAKKRDKLWSAILEHYDPPFGGIEDIGNEVGEGYRVSEIRSRREGGKSGKEENQDA